MAGPALSLKINRFRLWLGISLLLLAVGGMIQLLLPEDSGGRALSAQASFLPPADGMEAILPIPPLPSLAPERVALGERLFRDTRFSADGTLSCASCHDLGSAGADRKRFSAGIGGALGTINTPTVFNSSLNFVQFWDGRASTLEEQVAGPIHNPLELGSNWQQVLGRLGSDPETLRSFRKAYPDGLSIANVVDPIATFERSLLTPDSRFDRYLRGDENALTELEASGYRRFRELGCTSCHQGRLVGGNMYQKFGVLGDYFAGRELTEADLGRYNVTRREEDKHVFKVPSLRLVASTPPYFHDGSTESLAEAILIMGRYQLGRELSIADVESISAFLSSLEGPRPAMSAP